MKIQFWAVFVLMVAVLMLSAPLLAHHGNASYDSKEVTIKGTVTAWLWTNPHTFLKLDVTDDKGNVVHWICENEAPSTLINFGFTPKTFKPGDMVTVVLSASSKTQPVGRISKTILANGYTMNSGLR